MWEFKITSEVSCYDDLSYKSYYFNNINDLYIFKDKLECLLKTQEILNKDYYQLQDQEIINFIKDVILEDPYFEGKRVSYSIYKIEESNIEDKISQLDKQIKKHNIKSIIE